jgi:putative transposase
MGSQKLFGRLNPLVREKLNNLRKTTGVPVWQRSFYDRIIRNERELQKISEYIQSNPQNWQEDEYINYR